MTVADVRLQAPAETHEHFDGKPDSNALKFFIAASLQLQQALSAPLSPRPWFFRLQDLAISSQTLNPNQIAVPDQRAGTERGTTKFSCEEFEREPHVL